MLSYFDYIFYRVYTFYEKKGDDHPLIQSLNFISVCQLVCIFTLLQLVDKLSSGRIKVSLLDKNAFWVSWASLIVVVYVLNVLKYVRKGCYKQVTDKYYNSSMNIKLKIWMIFIQPLVLLLITITLLVLVKHNSS